MARDEVASDEPASRAIILARESYGKLIAILSARSGDVAAAEDALGEAFRAALETWPVRGVPDNPAGWLITVAKRRSIDEARREAVRGLALGDPAFGGELAGEVGTVASVPDERLKLLFVCAHPAIDPAMHTPLMLQTVMGLDAAAIARAFLMPVSAMAQRLVRVKTKIREARIPFAVPERAELADRLDAVRGAIYAVFGTAWDDDPAGTMAGDLGQEALFLADLLCRLVPGDAENLGLSALIAFCESRRTARRAADGRFVPLDAQDIALWDRGLITHAERCLFAARVSGPVGRYQLEAAIQSVHADRARTGRTDWAALEVLYNGLVTMAPTIGAAVGRALAIAHRHGPDAGLAALDSIEAAGHDSYQPYWAARAHLLVLLGRGDDARDAYERAIVLSRDRTVMSYLRAALEAVAATGDVGR